MSRDERESIRTWVNAGVTPYLRGLGKNINDGLLDYIDDAEKNIKLLLDALEKLEPDGISLNGKKEA